MDSLSGHRPADARRLNRAKALELLRVMPRGRAELARALGLSKPALGDLVGDLIEQGLLLEAAPTPIQRGRHPAPLRINPERFCVVGIDLSVDESELGLYNPLGQPLRILRTPSGLGKGPEVVYRQLLEAARQLLEQASAPVVAVGVASPGPIDFAKGTILAPPHFPDLHHMPLVERLQGDLGLPVYLEHDSAAAARRFLRSTAAENFIYILLHRGIGAGLVVGRQVYRGQHGFAGELGHVSLDSEGEPCPCGNRGCLENVAGTTAIESRYFRLTRESLPLGAIAQRAQGGDPLARLAFEQAGRALGWAAVNLVNLFDPELLVLGGPGAAYADLLIPSLRHHLNTRAYPYLGWGEQLHILVDPLANPIGPGAAECALEAVYLGEIPLPQAEGRRLKSGKETAPSHGTQASTNPKEERHA
ncbi:ROK family protein [Meiothermus sp. PNK-Is4]|nr:ROK family protein [Meiothermus sp. Pnk-1]RYM35275.1 ROK family protein [Meiothermus sp. PNK-Is4]